MLDTTTDAIAAGWFDAGCRAIATHEGRQQHSQALLSLVDQVRHAGETPAAIVVVRGPGAYSGLRVGLSSAQALGVALGAPVHGVDTFAAIAAAVRASGAGGSIELTHPAGRGNYSSSHLRDDGQRAGVTTRPAADIDWRAAAGEGAGARGGLEIDAAARCEGAFLAYLAGDIAPAEALYLREPHITTRRTAPTA